MKVASAVVLLGFLAAGSLTADDSFVLGDGGRIVFFGDSITQGGHYVTDVEAYLLTRFPTRRYTIFNHGISSETISGTSEPDHDPRRPDAHDRFTRDVTAWRPDVVVACFGMNDGSYAPPDEARFALYRKGVGRLIDRTRDEARARLVLMTPPPYDPYRRQVGDPEARTFGYRFPAVNYDETLSLYSLWLAGLREDGVWVVDPHESMDALLRLRREGDVSFAMAGDGVHPDETGHWLMAQTLLLGLGAPGEVAEAWVDAGRLEVLGGEVRDLKRSGEAITFAWETLLPAPLPPECDRRMLELAGTSEKLNRYRLAVTGLAEGRYRVVVNLEGEPEFVGEADAAALADGLDLNGWPEFPTVRLAREVLARLRERNQAEARRWREAISAGVVGPSEPSEAYQAATEAIRALCRPRTSRVRIEPI